MKVRETFPGGAEKYYNVGRRADLYTRDFQAALGRARERQSTLGCGCREAEGIWPGLGARRSILPVIDDGISRYFWLCVRSRVVQHGPACPFRDIYDDQPALPLSTSIFGLPGDQVTRDHLLETLGAFGDASVDTLPFHRFASHTAAIAATEAFITVNPGRPPRCQPNNNQFFQEWRRALLVRRFDQNRDAYEAAKSEGSEILIGIVFDLPTGTSGGGPELLSGYWWDGAEPILRAGIYLVSRSVLFAGSGRIRQRRGQLPPPYLAMAVVGPDGTVRHLWLEGIWTDGRHMVFTASGGERRHAGKVVSTGGIIYVPLLAGDLDRLVALFPPRRMQLVWRYRPDAIVWWPDAKPSAPVVKEVRGFRPGDNSDYDRDFAKKEPWYRSLEPWVSFLVEPSWEWPAGGERFTRHDWVTPALRPGFFSPAAGDRWRQLLARLAARYPAKAGMG